MQQVLDAVWDDMNTFAIAFNVHVDYLKKLTMNDADSNAKYDVTTRIVGMTLRHLREADISKEERIECEVLLAFYQFLQALYEKKFNPRLRQEYVDRLAEAYNEKRIVFNLPDTSENCDFLGVGLGWQYVDYDKYKLIKG